MVASSPPTRTIPTTSTSHCAASLMATPTQMRTASLDHPPRLASVLVAAKTPVPSVALTTQPIWWPTSSARTRTPSCAQSATRSDSPRSVCCGQTPRRPRTSLRFFPMRPRRGHSSAARDRHSVQTGARMTRTTSSW